MINKILFSPSSSSMLVLEFLILRVLLLLLTIEQHPNAVAAIIDGCLVDRGESVFFCLRNEGKFISMSHNDLPNMVGLV